ncbi:MAG TPA: PspC domain-containing protein [bacterium]|nr:PspC domain-containing protein [bacterium]
MKKLYRSSRDMYIGGVCGGLGEVMNVDSNIIRIIFILFAIFGAGVLIYLVMWAVLPLKTLDEYEAEEHDENTINMEKTRDDVYKIANERNIHFLGTLLIFVGALFLINNLFLSLKFHKIWPLIIIIIGLVVIFGRDKNEKK